MPRRRADRVDANQPEIVKELRKLDGVTVQVGMDDILVGYEGRSYWFEIKTGPKATVKESQLKLLDNWKGHYSIVWSVEMITNELGYKHG
jgi:hypothetical protein